MRGMTVLALIALLTLAGCMSDNRAEVKIVEPTEDPVEGPLYFSIQQGTSDPQVSQVETWTIEPGESGFDLRLSSSITGLTVRLTEIPYEVEPGTYPIVAQEAPGQITADVLGAEDALLYHGASGTLTITQAGDVLAGTFEFSANPVPGQAAPDSPVTVSGGFDGIDAVPTSALG